MDAHAPHAVTGAEYDIPLPGVLAYIIPCVIGAALLVQLARAYVDR